jgi:hypothetical protein
MEGEAPATPLPFGGMRGTLQRISAMRSVIVSFLLAFAFLNSGCKNAPPANEQYQERPSKTVYRAADEETREEPPAVAPQQKVPGQ